MGPVQAVNTCLRKYATFSGRASRSEFWWFTAAMLLSIMAAFALDLTLFEISRNEEAPIFYPITEIVSLGYLLPSAAAQVRRLHDIGAPSQPALLLILTVYALGYAVTYLDLTGRVPDYDSATSYLVCATYFVVVCVGFIILSLLPSQSATNPYGPNPNEVPT
ncbi:DUF805 domain-containing protein [Litoreibacter albidus]|uniref:Uncharacterized membrane protein YhaH, DUF805 family n=1 Tax=Litoreibacter albidus TaxID=670155 RepID=A0A1H2ZGP7_9RHOB|nr:DUF805 domain-containing protein [Litoreibacter albidus]SDX16662.1 Uncharacterized membrane protein YhaH, DUF805 family [Litoreibacter albidus]